MQILNFLKTQFDHKQAMDNARDNVTIIWKKDNATKKRYQRYRIRTFSQHETANIQKLKCYRVVNF